MRFGVKIESGSRGIGVNIVVDGAAGRIFLSYEAGESRPRAVVRRDKGEETLPEILISSNHEIVKQFGLHAHNNRK